MITVKNGYTLSECSQQEYTYRYQAMPSSVQRAVSAPEFSIIEESEDRSALALYTLQGDIIKVNNGMGAGSQFNLHNDEINITAITELGSGNLYFRWWAEETTIFQTRDWWEIKRSYRYNEGSTTITTLNTVKGYPKWRLICTDMTTQKNNHDKTIYPVARGVIISWCGANESWDSDRYLSSQNRRVLLSSQGITRTDYLYTVTGGIITP